MSEQTSIWKREIHIGRKRLDEAVEAAVAETPEPTQSVWKKDINLGRKRPAEAPAREVAEVAAAPAAAPAAEAATETKQSVWKKEIRFGSGPADHPSFWKKEIRFLAPRKLPDAPEATPKAKAPAAPVAEPEPEPAAVAAPVVVAPEPELAPEPVVVGAPEPEPEAVAPVAFDAVQEREPEPEPEPVPEPEVQRPAAETTEQHEEPLPAEPALEVVAEPEPEPASPEPPEHLKALFAPRVDEALQEIDARLAAAKAAMRAALAAPLPAGDAKAAPQQAHPQAPFWKRELKLGRTPKAKRAPGAPAQPFWKQDLSLGRKPKPAVAQAAKPAGPSQPFWKKDLSFGGKSKPAGGEKSPQVPFWKRDLKRSGSATPKPAKPPLLKRELSLSSLSMPKLPSRGGGEKGQDGLVKVVGLRIGSSQLAAALVHNNGSAEVLQLARSPLAPGLVSVGEVRDPDALGQALKRFFSEHKLPKRGVRLGVATNRIGVRMLEVPTMDDPAQLANAIRFRAQEVLPFPLTEAVLDHIVVGDEIETRNGKSQRVLVVFAHRELVDGYLAACKRAGLKLAGIDFDAFALVRALSAKEAGAAVPRAALVAVAIGHERTIFAVSDGEVCDFARVLEWGGASVDEALAHALQISVDDAARLKLHVSLSGDGSAALTPEQLTAARAAIRDELQTLTRELVSSLQFYQSRPGSLDIGELLLTGGGAQLGGIDDELGKQLGVPVRVGDPLEHVTSRVAPRTDVGSLAIAVGLGIEG